MASRDTTEAPRAGGWGGLALYLLLTVGGGMVIGLLTAPDAWYAELEKPFFNPPNWLFGPVWTALYVLIGIAGWRIHRAGDGQMARLWWMQLAVNFLWSPVFFAAHQIALALLVILVMLALILALVVLAARRLPTVAWLLAPYLLWVAYAALLNGAILVLN
jgi:tryptophan-rich sensory protein